MRFSLDTWKKTLSFLKQYLVSIIGSEPIRQKIIRESFFKSLRIYDGIIGFNDENIIVRTELS